MKALFNLQNRALLIKVEFRVQNVIEDKLFNKQQLDFYTKIRTNQTYVFFDKRNIKSILLVNIKASNRAFIDKKFVKFYKLLTLVLRNFIKLRFANNKFVFNITYIVQITIDLYNYVETL